MYAYCVRPPHFDNITPTAYLFFDGEVTFETKEENLAVLRSDYKFVVYQSKIYRVCEIDLDDPAGFIKFWHRDPFSGFPDYEQIDTQIEYEI